MKNVLCQLWEESERGWGVRPDGFSLHLTKEDCEVYVKKSREDDHALHLESHPSGPAVPDEYSRPRGEPFLVEVDEETYLSLTSGPGKKNRGVRSYDFKTPKRA